MDIDTSGSKTAQYGFITNGHSQRLKSGSAKKSQQYGGTGPSFHKVADTKRFGF